MQWIVKFSIVFQCNSVKRNAADADRWIAAVSQPHDSRLREREGERVREWARGQEEASCRTLLPKKGHFYCISLIFCEATFAVDSFVGTICWGHTHIDTDTITQQRTAFPLSPHYPDYLQLKLFSPYYISVSNPKMLENFCTTSVRTLHLLKTRTDEIEKPCPRDDVGLRRREEAWEC